MIINLTRLTTVSNKIYDILTNNTNTSMESLLLWILQSKKLLKPLIKRYNLLKIILHIQYNRFKFNQFDKNSFRIQRSCYCYRIDWMASETSRLIKLFGIVIVKYGFIIILQLKRMKIKKKSLYYFIQKYNALYIYLCNRYCREQIWKKCGNQDISLL